MLACRPSPSVRCRSCLSLAFEGDAAEETGWLQSLWAVDHIKELDPMESTHTALQLLIAFSQGSDVYDSALTQSLASRGWCDDIRVHSLKKNVSATHPSAATRAAGCYKHVVEDECMRCAAPMRKVDAIAVTPNDPANIRRAARLQRYLNTPSVLERIMDEAVKQTFGAGVAVKSGLREGQRTEKE